jgi:hypothetical protein
MFMILFYGRSCKYINDVHDAIVTADQAHVNEVHDPIVTANHVDIKDVHDAVVTADHAHANDVHDAIVTADHAHINDVHDAIVMMLLLRCWNAIPATDTSGMNKRLGHRQCRKFRLNTFAASNGIGLGREFHGQ